MLASSPSRLKWWLGLCSLVFFATVTGAVLCGEKMGACGDADQLARLRMLIYWHFALAQMALLGAACLLYAGHRQWRRYYLIISYNEKGMQLNPPGIRMPRQRVFRCHLGNISRGLLPPPDAPVLVYPMFMLSGRSSGDKLERLLRQAYAHEAPQLVFQPVLGASPWLAQAAARCVRAHLAEDTGVLVVAHDSDMEEYPPEPALFCRRLRESLPPGTEVCFAHLKQPPRALDALGAMRSGRVLLLPFLLTEGVHTARDLPTPQQAAACGKELLRLPVAADWLSHSDIS